MSCRFLGILLLLLKVENHESTLKSSFDSYYPLGLFEHPSVEKIKRPSEISDGTDVGWLYSLQIEAHNYIIEKTSHSGNKKTLYYI